MCKTTDSVIAAMRTLPHLRHLPAKPLRPYSHHKKHKEMELDRTRHDCLILYQIVLSAFVLYFFLTFNSTIKMLMMFAVGLHAISANRTIYWTPNLLISVVFAANTNSIENLLSKSIHLLLLVVPIVQWMRCRYCHGNKMKWEKEGGWGEEDFIRIHLLSALFFVLYIALTIAL